MARKLKEFFIEEDMDWVLFGKYPILTILLVLAVSLLLYLIKSDTISIF